MRLKHIHIAGFKSFVDPVTIPATSQLTGIVGPNGCGKSNVIDAVRWVLGESKARELRGASMQDVIFNGSAGRKPASRASVELLFDNSLGKAAGQWSQYAEIAVKRVLTRTGDSSYWINNVQVRKKDMADLFLGTGLGGDAYAIIEQGMISRIIEAKPEELRGFLEEAAGVSKYKERRKETESRLRDTRENLDRVSDIREELGRQLEKLAGQAEVARRYFELDADKGLKTHWLALIRRRDAQARQVDLQRQLE
ncbi:MAG TPA: AAA family ATPase, partial [Thiobacillaceae bacterium]|nr:AAA family ATPase [Thiobacillaceae bacterium]